MGFDYTADGLAPVSHRAEYRDHPIVDPAAMRADPAHAAEREGLVDEHGEAARRAVGAWRWPPLQRHRERLLPLIVGRRVIDFGGSAGPIGYGAHIVDRLAPEKALYDVAGEFETIAAIHVLEHLVDLRLALAVCEAKLVAGGCLIVLTPSWRHRRLNADRWPFHAWTFALSTDPEATGKQVFLDRFLAHFGLAVEIGEDDGVNLFLLARKPHESNT